MAIPATRVVRARLSGLIRDGVEEGMAVEHTVRPDPKCFHGASGYVEEARIPGVRSG